MTKKKSAKILRLPIEKSQSTTSTSAPTSPDESWSPLCAAQFYSEISESIGPYKTPAQVYRELAEFDPEKLPMDETTANLPKNSESRG